MSARVVIGVEGEQLDQRTQDILEGKIKVENKEERPVEVLMPEAPTAITASKSSNKGKWMMVALSIVALLIGLALMGFGFYAFFSHGVVHGIFGNYWPLVMVGLGGIIARLGFGGAAGTMINEIYTRFINPNKKELNLEKIQQNAERSEEESRQAVEELFNQ